jgi:hypothetical protein
VPFYFLVGNYSETTKGLALKISRKKGIYALSIMDFIEEAMIEADTRKEA